MWRVRILKLTVCMGLDFSKIFLLAVKWLHSRLTVGVGGWAQEFYEIIDRKRTAAVEGLLYK